MEKKSNRR